MTIPAIDAPAYTDLAGLTALKRGAAGNDPKAIREVARQFESLFTRMMLKSMRDASGKDPLFGSDQEDMYEGMADDQMALQLSRGRGLGLADLLVRQLQRMGVRGAGGDAPPATSAISLPSRSAAGSAAGTAAYLTTQRATQPGSGGPAAAVSSDARQDFVLRLWPQAQQAAQQLGIDPRNLIAQAALETHWGRNIPQDSSGRSSHNLFGVKASADWTGTTISAPTTEYVAGVAAATHAVFRAYVDPGHSLQDYVALLRDDPRYRSALNTGSDAQAFATALQRGGFATDPEYVDKISAVARNVTETLARQADVTDLKSASARPISSRTGAPQRL